MKTKILLVVLLLSLLLVPSVALADGLLPGPLYPDQASIGAHIFVDTNDDGWYQWGEEEVPCVVVMAWIDRPPYGQFDNNVDWYIPNTEFSDSNGRVLWGGMAPGRYILHYWIPDGYVPMNGTEGYIWVTASHGVTWHNFTLHHRIYLPMPWE